ncbi:MAG: DUF58 domain-containing protein [Chloroflexi bacterium]|nr:MAG: DUF58 domain-containing protein [Chloroflexota bacterium]
MANFSVFLGLLLLIAIILRVDFVFYIIYVLLGLWLLARVGLKRAIGKLTWQRHLAGHAFLGDTVEVQLEITNRSWLPLPWLRVTDSVPINLFGGDQARQLFSLGRGESHRIHYQLQCNRRGYYPIGPLSITGGDALGFVEATYRASEQDYLTVYPKISPLANVGLRSPQPFGTLRSSYRIFEDPSRLAGLRSYQTGDSIRRIHWKASAHADDLLVKKVEPAMALESFLVLDLFKNSYHRQLRYITSEWSISLTASIAYYLIQAGQNVGLAVNGADPLHDGHPPRPIAPAGGNGALMQMLEILARITIGEHPPTTEWLSDATVDLSWGTTLVVIAPRGDDDLLSALHMHVRRGFNVTLIATEPFARFARIQSRARLLGFDAFNITNEADLKNWSALMTPSGRHTAVS